MVVLKRRFAESRVNGAKRPDKQYKYMGLFVDDVDDFYRKIDTLLKQNGIKERHAYGNNIKDPHVTLRHVSENKPFLDDLFDMHVKVEITHYGYDDALGNEGVKIRFVNLPNNKELKDMIKTNGDRIGGEDKYHITLSIRDGSFAKNTSKIKDWQELNYKDTIDMVMDGFVNDDK